MPRDFFKTSRCSRSLAFSARNRRISASRASTLRLDFGSLLAALDSRSKCAQRYSSGGRIPSSAATFAALRPLARHNSNASFLYSSVYLALLRAGLLNCVFMWASFRVLTLSPLSVKSMQPYIDGLPVEYPDHQWTKVHNFIYAALIEAAEINAADAVEEWLRGQCDEFRAAREKKGKQSGADAASVLDDDDEIV